MQARRQGGAVEDRPLPVKPGAPGARGVAEGWALALAASLAVWEVAHLAYPRGIPGILGTLEFIAREGGGVIGYNMGLTLARSVAGFVVGFAAAVALGFAYTLDPRAREAVRALNTILQSISVLIWVVVFVMVFGVLSPLPPVLVAAMVSLPILLAAVVSGLDASSRRLAELAWLLGAGRLEYYRDFLLPSLAPPLAGATRSALGAALRISVVAEAFGSSGGVGYMIANYYNLAEPRGVFAWGLLLVALMIALDKGVLEPVERRASRWSVEA
jgi:NitT/TauT family transport system permease protein